MVIYNLEDQDILSTLCSSIGSTGWKQTSARLCSRELWWWWKSVSLMVIYDLEDQDILWTLCSSIGSNGWKQTSIRLCSRELWWWWKSVLSMVTYDLEDQDILSTLCSSIGSTGLKKDKCPTLFPWNLVMMKKCFVDGNLQSWRSRHPVNIVQ